MRTKKSARQLNIRKIIIEDAKTLKKASVHDLGGIGGAGNKDLVAQGSRKAYSVCSLCYEGRRREKMNAIDIVQALFNNVVNETINNGAAAGQSALVVMNSDLYMLTAERLMTDVFNKGRDNITDKDIEQLKSKIEYEGIESNATTETIEDLKRLITYIMADSRQLPTARQMLAYMKCAMDGIKYKARKIKTEERPPIFSEIPQVSQRLRRKEDIAYVKDNHLESFYDWFPDCGHSIYAIPLSELPAAEKDGDFSKYLCPFPLDYVKEKGFSRYGELIVCDGEYDQEYGLLIDEKYIRYD